jgi:hypothetical protein
MFQADQNRALVGGLPSPAGADQASQCRCKRSQVVHFGFNMFQLGYCSLLHLTAVGLRTDLQSEQFSDLVQREAERLGILDKTQAPERILTEEPIPGCVSHRRAQ